MWARSTRTEAAVRPAQLGRHNGLAYALWRPEGDAPQAGIVVIHGAGSSQESHYDFARAGRALGLAVLTFDQRGHGASPDRLDDRAVSDVVAMADLLRHEHPSLPVALRGSSLGGYLALRAAAGARADAVVAICPASAGGLRRALGNESLSWQTDPEAFTRVLDEIGLSDVVAQLEMPVLLLHAQGDEQVPVQHSRELAGAIRSSGSRLIEVPGGHHRSIQHDDELQAVSLRFVQRALGLDPSGRARRPS